MEMNMKNNGKQKR